MNKRITISFVLIAAALLMAVNVGTAQADGGTLSGIIVAEAVDDLDPCTFDLEVLNADLTTTIYHVVAQEGVPEGFTCASLVLGSTIDVDGSLAVVPIVDGLIFLKEFSKTVDDVDYCIFSIEVIALPESSFYTVELPCDDYDLVDLYTGDATVTTFDFEATEVAVWDFDGGYFCQNPDAQHPTGAKLAEQYGVSYQSIMQWFCKPGEGEGTVNPSTATNGFGNIKLAFETAEFTGGTAEEYLTKKEEGAGWGTIWKDLCYHGKPKDGKEQFSELCETEGSAVDPGAETLEAADESDKQTGPPDHAQNKKPKKPKKNE
jgi:hypothetical protein